MPSMVKTHKIHTFSKRKLENEEDATDKSEFMAI